MQASQTALARIDSPEIKPHRMQILLLDDNEIDRYRLVRLCRSAGLEFDPVEAVDLPDFRDALDTQPFDLVFIDYFLPGGDGLEAIDVLNAHPDQASAVSIMIAGEGQMDIAIAAMRSGCSDYLTKNELSPEALQKSVAAAFERKLMVSSASKERAGREALEGSIKTMANECSSEMRVVLAAMLRRVRLLRNHDDGTGDLSRKLETIEDNWGDLWDAVTRLQRNADEAIGATQPRLEQD